MGSVRRTLSVSLQLLLSASFSGRWYPMLSSSFKDDLRLGQCITSVVFEDDVGIDVGHLVAMVTNLTDHLGPFQS